MIEEITLKFTNSEDITINTKGVVIFVGANNSGKSLILREIEEERTPSSSEGEVQKTFQILKNVKSSKWENNERSKILSLLKHRAGSNNGIRAGKTTATISVYESMLNYPSDTFEIFKNLGVLNGVETPDQVGKTALLASLEPHFKLHGNIQMPDLLYVSQHSFERWFDTTFQNSLHTRKKTRDWLQLIRLDGRSRFTLTEGQPRNGIKDYSRNTFSSIFYAPKIENNIRKKFKEAFNQEFFIDAINSPNLEILFSPKAFSGEKTLKNPNYVDYCSKASPISEFSDGTQCFAGIITASYSSNYSTILLDEPEAFLHPPLAKKLGADLVATMQGRKGSLLAATHSANFVMGCLQASDQIEIIRLEYQNGKSKGYKVKFEQLKKFLNDPLIRNMNVISGLFYDGVIVTESETDRLFYQEIYTKILTEEQQATTPPDILFINAQNKQTIPRILQPLRTFGVPTIGIADIDAIREDKEWKGFISPFFDSEEDKKNLTEIRNSLAKEITSLSGVLSEEGNFKKEIIELITATASKIPESDRDLYKAIEKIWENHKAPAGAGWKKLKRQGFRTFFTESMNTKAINNSDELLTKAKEYGMFIVPNGELESWLPQLNLPHKKKKWREQVFPKLANISPEKGDVWDFVREMISWVQDSSRKGMDTKRGEIKP